MAANSLQELFVEELRDMYDAEKRITKALPKMAKSASSEELQEALTEHLQVTQNQISRLEQVFEAIGEKPRGKKCDGMMGIVEEGNTAIEELEAGPVRDAALIAGAQKVEHYEIASYGTLAYFAELLGHDDAKKLLGQTLDEEKEADDTLSELAKSKVNREALMGMDQSEETSASRGSRRGRTLEMAVAHDRSTGSKSRGSRSGSSRSSSSRAGSSRSGSTRSSGRSTSRGRR
jgi:ferritin-like metal-binding protein YciE